MDELEELNKKYCFFDSKDSNDNQVRCSLNLGQDVKNYWNRVFFASMKLAEHIFNTPEGKHPLMYENVEDSNTLSDFKILMISMSNKVENSFAINIHLVLRMGIF